MRFCNINFNIYTKEQLFERLANETKCIATVNAQFIVLANTNKRYMDYINDNYATFDGEIPFREAKKLLRNSLNNTTQHNTTQHNTTQHNTTQ
ncbi:MAG: hypothetical protein ACTTKD_07955, partial [Peptoanaerobacter stomatis]|uniref:hypothetical protein n=1 Tax=Peptoanaerobacter stomatis TaxID=796937 RepID=UPI003F9F4623